MKAKTYSDTIARLNSKNVFVFHSNGKGFHGAGSAAFAMFGLYGNVWRTQTVPRTNSLLHQVPDGTLGKYAIKGVSKGYQEGHEGRSYAIKTVENPGRKKSVDKEVIIRQIRRLYQFAGQHPKWDFLVAQGVRQGYSGYTPLEYAEMYAAPHPVPRNIVFHKDFSIIVSSCVMNRRPDTVATGTIQLSLFGS